MGPRTRGLDLVVEVLDETTSTNAVVAERARAGAGEGLVVVAEHQSAGRGRLDRSWEMPARSGLIVSVLLRPTVPPRDWPWLPLLTGYAVGRTLREAGFAAGVKWPNDALIDDRKVAGILVEVVDTPTGLAAVVGIGLNVDLAAEELPVPTATSLALEAGEHGTPDRADLLADLLATLLETYRAWQRDGEEGARRLRAAYREACVTLGRDVRVELPSGAALLGRATDIDDTGRLLVEGPDGPVAVGAGDVVHVRPA
ncbi:MULTISPECIES: biotin--[acetyl-CoA-carboxylase] ligase [unclassified Nocardioides]|uniref:biotin--[acetyl-CoA-carboxylase] ligase n=1 Tax=unclassified Nocardioides TaxID=2615069 RepID=UPI001E505ED0|nr:MULTISPECIES: biotin--[acetyl-CoA-carboxylase] ligase [unclassified Nocardioides]